MFNDNIPQVGYTSTNSYKMEMTVFILIPLTDIYVSVW